ncbi:MAG: phage portal protein [Lentisphaerae bacterium]|nr:phage portal protein [Lentisphaerota bacterium]
MKIPFISKWLERRSRSSTLSNPDNWLLNLFNGAPTKTGVNVNEASALKLTTVFACVRILSETVASLPLLVYRRTANGGKERVPEHPLYTILHDRANPEMTAMIFRETLMAHCVTWGNAYAYIIRDNAGRARELWPLLPNRTEPKRDERTNKLYYEAKIKNGEQIKLSPDEVLHIPGLGWDGIKGYSPIRMAREAIGLGLATEEFGALFFGQGTNIGGIAEHPGKLGEKAHKNLRNSLNETYQGLGKSHRLLLLEEGMKFQKVGVPPNDAQFLESRKFQVEEICRIFRVPPHLVASLDRATFSNIESQSIEFVVHTIRPWLVRWEQAIKMRLISEAEQQKYFAEHIVDGLLRGDIQSRYQAYAVGRQNGWLSANDIREKENMNPIEDGGDIYLVPLNMVPADQVGMDSLRTDYTLDSSRAFQFNEQRGIRSATARKRLSAAYEKIFQDVAARIVKREKADIRRALKKHFGERSSIFFENWLKEFYEEAPEWVQRMMFPIAMGFAEAIQGEIAEEINIEPGMTKELEVFTKKYVEAFSYRHTGSSKGQIIALIRKAEDENEDLVELIEERLDEWEEKRPGKVAMRETIQQASAVAVAVYKMSGVQRLKWVNTGSKSCPWCESMNGKIVGIEEHFVEPGEEWSPEGAEGEHMKIRGPIQHPPLHAGCQCMIIAV